MAKVPVLAQTKDYIAVDKPAGISVHNDSPNLLTTLEAELGLSKLYPVHRLDKETSGVQVLALTESAARKLAEEFQKRSVRKIYLGVLRGQLLVAEAVWAEPLTDKGEGRKNPAGIAKDRVPCETRLKVLQSSKYFTLCEFDLITGRQHQIRKHAALAKHALVGDGRYGDQTYNEKMAKMYPGADRMFLHCSQIELLGTTISSPKPAVFKTVMGL